MDSTLNDIMPERSNCFVDDVSFGNIMEKYGAKGMTLFATDGLSHPRIVIDKSLKDNENAADFVLAHEGTHASLYHGEPSFNGRGSVKRDQSEWREELAAMETVRRLANRSKKGCNKEKGLEEELAKHMVQYSTLTLIDKMKKEKKSDADIRSYLKSEFKEIPDGLMDASMSRETWDQLGSYEMRATYILPYVAMKMVQKGERLSYPCYDPMFGGSDSDTLRLDALKRWDNKLKSEYAPKQKSPARYNAPRNNK
jgi:hypothetical protein